MAVPLSLFLFALAARLVTGAFFTEPAYPDSYYYVNLARELAMGHGFSIDYIWNFVEVGGRLPDAASAVLPIPSNAHWMPLAALVQVPFIWLLGPTSIASALPFWLSAATAAPIAWWIGVDAGRPRWQALLASLLVAVPGGVAPYLSQPDNFALYLPLGALSLWACARGVRGDRRAYVVGGALVGVATLARSDGVLLGVPFALAFARDLWLRRRHPSSTGGPGLRVGGIGWPAALACAGAFVLVTGPWWLRQLSVFGSLSPSAASGRILWITDYRQLYSVTGDTSLATFLAQGIGPLLASRVGGFLAALGIFASMPLLVILAPFTGIGTWLRRRDPNFLPWLVYGTTLLAFSGLLFAVHVPYGTFLHSAVALLPHAYLLALGGITASVAWVATHRSSWEPERAGRVFALMAVVVVMLSGGIATAMTISHWCAEQQLRLQVAAALADEPAGDRLMSPDAGGYRFLAGRQGIVTPDDPLPVVQQALQLYDVRWLVLERDHITSALAPLLAGQERPPWLSRPVVTVPGSTSADADAEDQLPAAALFAVCLAPGDQRCAP
jgi:hypothetical protein